MKKVLIAFLVGLTLLVIGAVSCGGGGKSSPLSFSESTQEAVAKATPAPITQRAEYVPPHSMPGPAADKIIFGSMGVDLAVSEIKSGNSDFYMFGLKNTAARALAGDETVQVFRSPASSVSLLLNPAPDPKGLNPFSIKQVRQAMNFIVNRDFIAQELYGGFAEPMISHVSLSDPDYLTVLTDVLDKNIRYDFDYAKAEIERAMLEAGAELIGGKWHYEGKLIRLTFIIRPEDERIDIGNNIATALEKVGFEVNRINKQFAAAISTVYTSDPEVFDWHLYTEGWGRGAADKYDFANINSMTAPWMANMPGWQMTGFWQYENEKLDLFGKQLFTGSFRSREERDDIYREMTRLALEDAVRIWVVTVYNTFPAKKDLTGITEDLVAGPKSMMSLREAYLPNKSSLKVDNLWVWTERSVWNPVGGFGDVYSIDVWKNVFDPPMINHPFSGLPIPFRVSFEVKTAGPNDKLDVPADAIMWNAGEDRWEALATGTRAMSKVVFDYSKYFQSTWHHGVKITMADVLYSIYQDFEMTYDEEKKQREFVLASTRKPFLDVFKGFRIVDENRLEVYLDFWHFEENYIASYASLTSLPMPWEILAAMDRVVFQDKFAAYSQISAAKFNRDWLSLVMKEHANLTARALKQFTQEEFMPENILLRFVSKDGALARYSAALKWFDEHEHLVVSQGPFILNTYSSSKQYAELTAFRDTGYPFKPGDWFMARSDGLEFTKIDIPELKRGETGMATLSVSGPGNLNVTYFIVDPATGKVIKSGEAQKAAKGEFRVPLASSSESPVLHLELFLYSDEIVLITQTKIDLLIAQ